MSTAIFTERKKPPAKRRPRSTRPYAPSGERAQAVIMALGRYHRLNGEQFIRLVGHPGVRSDVYRNLKLLTKHHYLRMGDRLPPENWFGEGTAFWSLGERGRTFLQGRGITTLPRRHEGGSYDDDTLRHVRAINDCLIDLELFCRDDPEWELVDVKHDLLLKRTMMRKKVPVAMKRMKEVSLGDGLYKREEVTEDRLLYVVPDAVTWLRHETGRQPTIWWEIDLSGSEEEARWKEKVAAIIAFYQAGAYYEEFGTKHMLVAVPVYKGQSRLERLVRWTEQVIEKQAGPGWENTFRFTLTRPGEPQEFVLGEHWQLPFSHQSVSLFGQGPV